MGSSSEPEVPAYQGGTTVIGGREVATNRKVGDNIVTSYNPTEQEQGAYNYVQSQLTPLYQNAMTSQDFGNYADTYKQNQLDQLNKSYRQGLNTAKGALVSSGQSSSSQGLDRLQAFNTPYMEEQANINANAPLQAQQMQANQQNLANSQLSNAMGALNQYYNTGNTFMGGANTASNMGNSFAQQQYQNQMASYQAQQAQQAALISAGLQAAGGAMSAFGGGYPSNAGTGTPSSAGTLASDKNVKKNIVKIGSRNGINIYEFDYKADKYPELPKGKQIGVIAQEVEHIPNAVVQGDKYKLVDYAVILPLIA